MELDEWDGGWNQIFETDVAEGVGEFRHLQDHWVEQVDAQTTQRWWALTNADAAQSAQQKNAFTSVKTVSVDVGHRVALQAADVQPLRTCVSFIEGKNVVPKIGIAGDKIGCGTAKYDRRCTNR